MWFWTPLLTQKLIKNGATVKIQEGAGLGSGYSDAQYKAAGAEIVKAGMYSRLKWF